eukprot:GHVT01086674.1.p1 GENE.GHVT01086674.1~~GHVT01086674.1.p1  ORF type:complete len:297 (+),score=-0.63 GHVT01086674.1:423-1313(+)
MVRRVRNRLLPGCGGVHPDGRNSANFRHCVTFPLSNTLLEKIEGPLRAPTHTTRCAGRRPWLCPIKSHAFQFRSEAHRSMVVNMTRMHLQNALLQRFGVFRQMECRIITSKKFSQVLTAWAECLVQENPEAPNVTTSFPYGLCLATQSPNIDCPEISWLLARISASPEDDCIPYPTFPSVLKMDHPQYPFSRRDIDRMKDLYGLLKWPFYRRRPAEKRKIQQELRVTGGHATTGGAVKGVASKTTIPLAVQASSNGEEEPRIANIGCGARGGSLITGCDISYIYSPSDIETGLHGN